MRNVLERLEGMYRRILISALSQDNCRSRSKATQRRHLHDSLRSLRTLWATGPGRTMQIRSLECSTLSAIAPAELGLRPVKADLGVAEQLEEGASPVPGRTRTVSSVSGSPGHKEITPDSRVRVAQRPTQGSWSHTRVSKEPHSHQNTQPSGAHLQSHTP